MGMIFNNKSIYPELTYDKNEIQPKNFEKQLLMFKPLTTTKWLNDLSTSAIWFTNNENVYFLF